MNITNDNVYDTKVVIYTHLFCQLLYSLTRRNVNIFGSTVRNWIVPCYYRNMNPYKFASIVELTPFLNNEIDLWVNTDICDFKSSVEDISSTLKNIGYITEPIKCSYTDNLQIQTIKITPTMNEQFFFLLKIYGTGRFLNVDFDVNNLYIECSMNMGIRKLGLVSASHIKDNNGFGYLTSYNKSIDDSIYNIIHKQCNMLELDRSHDIDIKQYFNRMEKILDLGYTIQNHTALCPTIRNLLGTDKCTICLDELNDTSFLVETHCCHVFHRSCLFIWWRKKQTLECPNCRTMYSFFD